MEGKKVKTRFIHQEDITEEVLKDFLYDEHEEKPETIPPSGKKTILWNGKHLNCQWTKCDGVAIIRTSPSKENDPYIHELYKELGPRIYEALVKGGIKQFSETQNLSKSELKKDKKMGTKYTKLLEEIMARYGFKLKP